MKHLGDITQIHGDEIEPVDCITFGSPCQDLSVAGKRKGLAGERSGLFMEAVRIFKEMRAKDETDGRTVKLIRPRFAIWENVPGAFSSNKGEDFRAVLEELARVKQPDASIPRPTSGGGRWSKAGTISGDGWSLAWRTLDAQHWGVPQRRKRIALVVDFTGRCAREILFEHTGLRGDFTPGIQPWQGIARNPEQCTASDDRVVGCKGAEAYTLKIRSGCAGGGKGALVQTEKSATLSTLQDQTLFVHECLTPWDVQSRRIYEETGKWPALYSGEGGGHGYVMQQKCYGIGGYNSKGMLSDNPHAGYYEAATSRTLDLNGGSPACNQGGIAICQSVAYRICSMSSNCMKSKNPYSGTYETDVSCTLDLGGGNPACNQGGVMICEPHAYDMTHANDVIRDCGQLAPSLQARMGTGGNQVPIIPTQVCDNVAHTLKENASCQFREDSETYICEAKDCQFVDTSHADDAVRTDTVVSALQARDSKGGKLVTYRMIQIIRWIVRRLTPTECERLQGYPDEWTNIGEWIDSKGKRRKTADSPRYKALGNSIALPQWWWIICKMKPYLPQGATLGSLFDGIGGFPLVWETCHGKGTARWASEIEEFPIAVTKVRFPVED